MSCFAILANTTCFATNDSAELLGWQPDTNPQNLCQGKFKAPNSLQDQPILKKDAPITISSSGNEILKREGISKLYKDVVITQPGRVIKADKVFLFRSKHGKIYKIALVGRVRIEQQKSILVASDAIITTHPRTASVTHLTYHFQPPTNEKKTDAWGTAKEGETNDDSTLTFHHASYSTCSPQSPTWQVFASKIVIDKHNETGSVYSGTLKFHKLPVFWFPYYSFQISNKRKSGFLTPFYGHEDSAGNYLGLPYYFNLAPNYDLTVIPELYGKRGLRLAANFRYLSRTSAGHIRANMLPSDKNFTAERNLYSTRYRQYPDLFPPSLYQPYLNNLKKLKNARIFLSAQNQSDFSAHWRMRYFINWVSDDYYFRDITHDHTLSYDSTTDQLLNSIGVNYKTTHWDFDTSLVHYQTLHAITLVNDFNQSADHYSSLPSINVNTFYALPHNFDVAIDTNYDNFTFNSSVISTAPVGQRLHIRPGLSWTLSNSSAFIKPQAWLDNVAYSLNKDGLSTKNYSRTLPILDIDTGLHFVSDLTLKNQPYTATLEPRLFYLYVPHKNQDDLPNFNTEQLPFSFDQLFALNAYQGPDRLQNANQVSFGLTSNLIRNSDGNNIFSASLGSIHYFTQPSVCLIKGCAHSQDAGSPVVADLFLLPNNLWSLSSSLSWNPHTNHTNNANISISYHSDDKHRFILDYSYAKADPTLLTINHLVSTSIPHTFTTAASLLGAGYTWPLSARWATSADVRYDTSRHHLAGLYAGIKYRSCCWSIRFLINKLFNGTQINPNGTLKNNYDTGYFVELQLKGLTSFVSRSD